MEPGARAQPKLFSLGHYCYTETLRNLEIQILMGIVWIFPPIFLGNPDLF